MAHGLLALSLLSAIPLAGLEYIGHEAVEPVIIALVVVLAAFTFLIGCRTLHRNGYLVFGVIGLAICLLLCPAVGKSLEPIATSFGGSTLVIGHFLNWK